MVWASLVARTYANPPLAEAIFETFVESSPDWSQRSYERLASALKARFSGKHDVLEPMGLRFRLGAKNTSAADVRTEPARHRVWSPDGGEMFQYSPQMCAFNLLQRYRTFDAHKQDLEELTQLYLDEGKPERLVWVGQRYINKVALPSPDTNPRDYFRFYPELPEGAAHRPFLLQTVAATFPNGEVTLGLTFEGLADGKPRYVIDFYARSAVAPQPSGREIRVWNEVAHDHVRNAFEATFTGEARQLFGDAS